MLSLKSKSIKFIVDSAKANKTKIQAFMHTIYFNSTFAFTPTNIHSNVIKCDCERTLKPTKVVVMALVLAQLKQTKK